MAGAAKLPLPSRILQKGNWFTISFLEYFFTMNKKEVEPDNDIRSLKEKVLELFHQGLDIYYIAEKLDSSVAEVQTIVNLFGN